jgi:hypothetical protein
MPSDAIAKRPDHGAEVAALHGATRSEHWPAVERAFRQAHPRCAACPDGAPEVAVQVHHINPFHYVIHVGRPDLELDPRNLIGLCEKEQGRPAQDHHLLIGHLGDFKQGNLVVAADAAGRYHGKTEAAIRAEADWQNEERNGRIKALNLMNLAELTAFRARLDAQLPPDPTILAKYNLKITPAG